MSAWFGAVRTAIRLLLISTFLVPQVLGQNFTAKCVGVTDGDTITVLVGTEQMKIRLEGIDTPERGQNFSTRAKQFTSGHVFGKQLHILPKEMDRYGRLVARVQIDGDDISLELVKTGLPGTTRSTPAIPHWRPQNSRPELRG